MVLQNTEARMGLVVWRLLGEIWEYGFNGNDTMKIRI